MRAGLAPVLECPGAEAVQGELWGGAGRGQLRDPAATVDSAVRLIDDGDVLPAGEVHGVRPVGHGQAGRGGVAV